MANKKKTVRPIGRMNQAVSWFVLLLCSAVICLLVIALQPGSLEASLAGLWKTPVLLALNYLPVLLLAAFFFCLFGNVFTAAGITALIAEGLSYANLLKIEGRNDPLVPGDVLLIKESLVAAGDYHLNLHPRCIALLVCSVGGFFFLAFFLRSKKARWLPRIIAVLLIVALFAGLTATIYADKDFYNALPDVSKTNVPLVFNTYGFSYCFLHNLNLYAVEKPKGYDAAQVRQWQTQTLPKQTPLDVDVIFVMGEAFTDLSEEPCFAYAPEANPTYLYHQVADSERAVSGHIVVSNFGAGTANTEFDVLTGMQTNMIAPGATSAFRVVRHSIDSLARVYRSQEYDTWFLHPGKSWFYNRSNVFEYLGFEDQTYDDAFPAEAWAEGSFLPDSVLLEKIKEKHGAVQGSSFAFVTTIENHQAYHASKYTAPVTEQVQTDLTLTDAVREQLSVYFTGIRHTSKLVYDLAAYLDTAERPTLLVFFGDHRPAMGAEYQCYRAIGSEVGKEDTIEQVIGTYETPFTIWGNAAFCENNSFGALAQSLDLPENGRISSNYLGSLVYEMTGRTGSDAYFDYLTEARRTLPVISHDRYILPDGTYTDALTDEQAEVVDKLDHWLYYRLKTGYQE